MLQRKADIVIPQTMNEWASVQRTEMVIDRDNILSDALKVGNDREFNPRRLLKVFCQLHQLYTVAYYYMGLIGSFCG